VARCHVSTGPARRAVTEKARGRPKDGTERASEGCVDTRTPPAGAELRDDAGLSAYGVDEALGRARSFGEGDRDQTGAQASTQAGRDDRRCAAMDTTIALDGGPGELVTVTLDSFTLPPYEGVLLPSTPSPDNPDGLTFVRSSPYPPEHAARVLTQRYRMPVLVLCPRSTSPGRTRLALAVARLLADHRPADPAPVITSAVRPACAWESGVVVLPHLVSVVTDPEVQTRIIWQLLDPLHAVHWHDTASLNRVAPTMDAA